MNVKVSLMDTHSYLRSALQGSYKQRKWSQLQQQQNRKPQLSNNSSPSIQHTGVAPLSDTETHSNNHSASQLSNVERITNNSSASPLSNVERISINSSASQLSNVERISINSSASPLSNVERITNNSSSNVERITNNPLRSPLSNVERITNNSLTSPLSNAERISNNTLPSSSCQVQQGSITPIRCVNFIDDTEVNRNVKFRTTSKRKTNKSPKKRKIEPITTTTTTSNTVGSERCDTEKFRSDRDRFKRRTALEAYGWMTLNGCRLPATKIRSMYSYDFDLSEYPGINRILKNDDLGLSTTNMGIMFYSIVRPTPELVKMFECQNKVDVLAKVADAYNRLLHTQNIIAQTFIKIEWAANAEFAIFARQHRLPPTFCRTDSLWLRRIYPQTVQPIPDDVPMPHIQKAQTYKLRRDVAVYIIGCGDMSQISDTTGHQRFEYTGHNVYKMYYEVLASVPSYVLANCGWIFSEMRESRKRTIDTSRVYIERIPNWELLDDNHEAFFTAIEQFMLMWLNAESYAREVYRRKDQHLNTGRPITEPPLDRKRGTILHHVDFREKNRHVFKMFYFRNDDDHLSSMSCIDPFPDQTSLTQQTVQHSSTAVYFHETLIVASVYHNEGGGGTACPAHLAKSVRTDKEAVINMLSNSKHTINYKRDSSLLYSDTVLPYDPLYPGVKVSKKDEKIEKIFLNKIENGGNLNKEEVDFVTCYDRGRLSEDYRSDDEDEKNARYTTTSRVCGDATATWTDPTTSRPINIAIPVKNLANDKRHQNIVKSEVCVSVDEREFVSTTYFNEAGSEKGMRLDRFPPKHLSYNDHVIRISKIKYERDNVFRLFPEHYIVFRNLPCVVSGSHTLKDILDNESLCDEHKNKEDEYFSEEMDVEVEQNGAEEVDEFIDCDVEQWANRFFKSVRPQQSEKSQLHQTPCSHLPEQPQLYQSQSTNQSEQPQLYQSQSTNQSEQPQLYQTQSTNQSERRQLYQTQSTNQSDQLQQHYQAEGQQQHYQAAGQQELGQLQQHYQAVGRQQSDQIQIPQQHIPLLDFDELMDQHFNS